MKPSDIVRKLAVECCAELFGRETYTDEQVRMIEIYMMRAVIDVGIPEESDE